MASLFRCVKNCLRLWHCAFLYRYCLGLETSILYWELGLNSSLVLMKTCGWLIWSFKFIHTMGGVFPIFFLGIIVYILILAKLSSDAGCCCFLCIYFWCPRFYSVYYLWCEYYVIEQALNLLILYFVVIMLLV